MAFGVFSRAHHNPSRHLAAPYSVPQPSTTLHAQTLQVVCTETCRTLFGRNGGTRPRSEYFTGDGAESFVSRSDNNVGAMDGFLIPHPSRYVPDWAAFGPGERYNTEHGYGRSREHALLSFAQAPVSNDEVKNVLRS